jgi:acyl-CoA reductase-like NAD-dependent aldehyde dehydrogenase
MFCSFRHAQDLCFLISMLEVKGPGSSELVMVSCWKCGAQLAENAKYCHICGSAVKTRVEEFSVSADDLIEKIKQLIHEGNVTRIVIKDEKGKTLFEMPATVGVVGAILVPWLAALGAIAALATRCTLVVERAE